MNVKYTGEDITKNCLSIYLAGPNPFDYRIPSWKNIFCAQIKQLSTPIEVYFPSCVSTNFYDCNPSWIREAAENATLIALWIPVMKEQISDQRMLEYLEYFLQVKQNHAIVYGHDATLSYPNADQLYSINTNQPVIVSLSNMLDSSLSYLAAQEEKQKMYTKNKCG